MRVALVFALLLAGCSSHPAEAPDAVALYENGIHSVATFHGFADNFGACQIAAKAFNADSATDLPPGQRADQWTCAKAAKP